MKLMRSFLMLVVGIGIGVALTRYLNTPSAVLELLGGVVGYKILSQVLYDPADETIKTMWSHAEMYAKRLHIPRDPRKCTECPDLPIKK